MPFRRLWLLALFCLPAALHAETPTLPRYELSGGYSFLSNSFNGVAGSHHPLNGWDASLTTLDWHSFQLKIDVSSYSGTNQGAPQKPLFILAGAQYTRRVHKELIFAEGLIGDCGLNNTFLKNYVLTGQTASFAPMVGGGLDSPLTHRLAFRAEADYLYTNFGPALAALPSTTVVTVGTVHGLPNNFARISTSLVWRFW